MTYEEVKEVLHSYLKKLRLYKTYSELVNAARQDLDGLKAVDYGAIKVQGGIGSNSTEKAILRLDKLLSRKDKIMEEMFELEDKIAELITYLNDEEQTLIIDRYMQGASFRKIANKYCYDYNALCNKFTKI